MKGVPKGYKRGAMSEAHKRKIGAANAISKKGICPPIEQMQRLHENNKGKKRTEETRQRMRGENHYNWQGGITSLNATIRRSVDYKVWRTHVFRRDDYRCQACGLRGIKLQADHELPFAHYPDLRLEILNGRALCVSCHKKTPSYLNRWHVRHIL